MEKASQMIGYFWAGGQDVVAQRSIHMPADLGIGNRHIKMSRADDEGHASQPSRQAGHPSVARAVRIENLNLFGPQPNRQPQHVHGKQASSEIHWPNRNFRLRCAAKNLRVPWSNQPYGGIALLEP